jgi:hypothetical protein
LPTDTGRTSSTDSLATPPLEPGRFNSPRTVAADGDGNLYVTEYLLGGRFTKLVRS